MTKCPLCKRKPSGDTILRDLIPVVRKGKRPAKMKAWLSQCCAAIWIMESEIK